MIDNINKKSSVQNIVLKNLKDPAKAVNRGLKNKSKETAVPFAKKKSTGLNAGNGQLSFPATQNPFINHNSQINSQLNNRSDTQSTSCDTESITRQDGKPKFNIRFE